MNDFFKVCLYLEKYVFVQSVDVFTLLSAKRSSLRPFLTKYQKKTTRSGLTRARSIRRFLGTTTMPFRRDNTRTAVDDGCSLLRNAQECVGILIKSFGSRVESTVSSTALCSVLRTIVFDVGVAAPRAREEFRL